MQPSAPIPLPFTVEAALRLLELGCTPEASPYSHKQIAEWCDRYWCEYLDIDAPPEVERLLPLLTDVETQWDLYLANTFSLEQLRSQAFEQVCLPVSWFEDWLRQAREAVSGNASDA